MNKPTTYKYIVEYILNPLTDDIVQDIAENNSAIRKLMENGVLVSYFLSEDVSRVWMIFDVETEIELISYLDVFPLTNVANYKITKLLHHTHAFTSPGMNMN